MHRLMCNFHIPCSIHYFCIFWIWRGSGRHNELYPSNGFLFKSQQVKINFLKILTSQLPYFSIWTKISNSVTKNKLKEHSKVRYWVQSTTCNSVILSTVEKNWMKNNRACQQSHKKKSVEFHMLTLNEVKLTFKMKNSTDY